jgi:DNA-binding NtrC family response regulator
MNFSNPILICDENEHFRVLIRDMLTKNGFFHVVEASSTEEAQTYLSEKQDYFVITDSRILNHQLSASLLRQKSFLIFANHRDPTTPLLAAKVGVRHVINYPVHSRKLVEKIHQLL